MSKRVMKLEYDQNRSRPVRTNREKTERMIEYLLVAVLVTLCIGVAFYAKDGYHQIGNAKFTAYKVIMTGGGALWLGIFMPYLFFWVKEHRTLHLSMTDWFVLAYLISTGISVVSGGFYEDVLWGCPGWNMGLLSQLSFILLYFFVSRFGRYHRVVLTALGIVASIVYMIAILHRLMFDPIGFYDGLENYQKAQFLSTLGQATWYGSFLAVTLPVGIGVFLESDKKIWRVLSGIYMVLGFCTLVTQNSDSAYFAMAGAFLIFFLLSAQERGKMCRFMGALTLLFGSGKVMYFLMQIRPNPDLEPDFITKIMWTSKVTWVLFVGCLVLTVMLYVMGMERGGRNGTGKKVYGKERAERYPADMMQRICRIVPAVVVVIVLGTILVICLRANGVLPEALSEKVDQVSYFHWDDDWGNGRGRIWRFSARMFSEEKTGHKLFGVGPDCFSSYISAYYSEEEELFWGEKLLTNAHNEWLNILINGGILGAAAYLGIYVTAVRRFFNNHRQDILLAGIAAAVMSYMCYNFFCYQQVLCTPFIFILIGVGEYLLRHCD